MELRHFPFSGTHGSQVAMCGECCQKFPGKVEAKDVTQDENGKIHQLQSYLEATGKDSCLPAGDYRADFYLNGVPFYVMSEPLDTPSAMRASPFKDLNLALCRPNGWIRWRPGSENQLSPADMSMIKNSPMREISSFSIFTIRRQCGTQRTLRIWFLAHGPTWRARKSCRRANFRTSRIRARLI